MENQNNTTKIAFNIQFKESKKSTLKTYHDWKQIENICTLLNERTRELAESMSEILPENHYERIYSDPPYSIEDCDHYGCCMVKRNVVFKECHKIMKKGGILIWLDQVLPNYRKIEFDIIGRIGMVKSTNHRFRVITIFKKK